MKELYCKTYAEAIRESAKLEAQGFKTAVILGTPCIVRYWK